MFLMISLSAFGQVDSIFNVKTKALQELFSERNYEAVQFSDTSIHIIKSISLDKRDDKNTNNSTYLEKQKELLQRDNGLSLTGSYLENFNADIADLNDNLVYARKFQAGINWSILKNGFFDNKVDVKLLTDRIEREKLKNETKNQSSHYLKRFDKTIYIFNKAKINLLESREASLQKQYELLKELVVLKILPKQDLLVIEGRLSEIQSLKQVYGSYNMYLNEKEDSLALNLDNLTLIDLDYNSIFKLIEEQTKEIMGGNTYSNYYKWYHQIGLKANVKYNYYDLIGSTNRDFWSAGLNVNIPLFRQTKLKNEIAHEKWKYDNERLSNSRTDLHENVLNVAYEFRYKLKQFVAFYQKRKIFEEKLRIENVKVRLGDRYVDPMGGLNLVDDIVKIDIELIDLLQNLYLKALKIQSKIAFAKIEDIIVNAPIYVVDEYSKDKEKGVYVWSKTFDENDAGFLAEYCIYNHFHKTIVSASVNDSRLKSKKAFANFLKNKADYYLMIGSNKLFYHEDIIGQIDKICNDYKDVAVKGIHIDIEPHTFPEWKTDKMKLLDQYVKMIGEISTYCKANNLELDISIPLHYNELIIDKLFARVDQVYFMAYENVKDEYIYKKVQKFVDNQSENIVIALRTEDFNNRLEMNDKVDALKKITNIQHYAYHDLARLLKQDKDNLKK
jgi:hypothetical protein